MTGIDLLLPARVGSVRTQSDPARAQRHDEADAAASDFASALLGALGGVPAASTVVAAGSASSDGGAASLGTSIANAAGEPPARVLPIASLPLETNPAVLGIVAARTAAVESAAADSAAADSAAADSAAGAPAAAEHAERGLVATASTGIPVLDTESVAVEGSVSLASQATATTAAGSVIDECVDGPRQAPAGRELAQQDSAGVAPQTSPRDTPELTAALAPRASAEQTVRSTPDVRASSTAGPIVEAVDAQALAAQTPARVATAAAAAGVAATPAPNLAAQLSGTALALARRPDGTHTVTMSVNPETLGPVTVRAIVDPTGIRIELHAAEHAREALRAVLPELRRDLTGFAAGARLDLAEGGAGDASRSPDRDAAAPQRDDGAGGQREHGAARERSTAAELAQHRPPPTEGVRAMTVAATPDRRAVPGTPTIDILT